MQSLNVSDKLYGTTTLNRVKLKSFNLNYPFRGSGIRPDRRSSSAQTETNPSSSRTGVNLSLSDAVLNAHTTISMAQCNKTYSKCKSEFPSKLSRASALSHFPRRLQISITHKF